jgi:hypothetical protein
MPDTSPPTRPAPRPEILKLVPREGETCAKCGSAELLVRWVAHRENWTYAFNSSDDREEGEHLRVRCNRCLYAWNTPTLDAARTSGSDQ